MKSIPLLRWLPFVSVCFALALNPVWAVGDNNTVLYDPTSEGVYGDLPVTHTYTLTVTCPGSVVDFPTTVNLELTADTPPVGDKATALSYVRFSAPTLTFNSPGEEQKVTVTITLPSTALNANVPAGAYTYYINTTGWPADVVDSGAQINATVSMPGAPRGNPPVVSITGPSNYASFSYPAGTFPHTIPFTFTASTDATSPLITSVAAMFGTPPDMTSLSVTADGMGTANVSGAGSFTVNAPGIYQLRTTATNSIGTASDEHTVTIDVTVPPPTVQITSPGPNALFTYREGDPALQIPFTFVANTVYGGIKTLTATVDGVSQTFSATGLNTLSATATVYLSYTAEGAGAHSLVVTTTDIYNQTATTTGSFTINYVEPLPHVVINSPTAGQEFVIPVGQTTAVVPYTFVTTVSNGFGVTSVSATVNGNPLSPSTVDLGLPLATSTGTMTLPAGTYELIATGGCVGKSDTAKVIFTVKSAARPPSVVINSPANGFTQEIVPGATATIPFKFTGTSNNPGSVITALTATLDGVPVAFACSTLNQPVAIGTATLTFTTAGTHNLAVTATDANGTAMATSTFKITLATPHAVGGITFFDVDGDGTRDAVDYGLANITLKLVNSSCQVVATTVSDASGSYSFPGLYAGSYKVVATGFAGLTATTATTRTVTMGSANVTAEPIGFGLNLCAIGGMKATGFTIGYWKNNVEKAIAGKTAGTQVNAATINAYTNELAAFALQPFDGLTKSMASAIMGSNSSKPADLLAKQLLASEYNYENKAYLNGNATLTYAFVYWGENVLRNSSSYSSSYVIWVKDWFDAYNNTHGGVVGGP